MKIDWFTLIAQIVNFLILVGLLKYFLFGKITQAMDERKQGINARLKEAEDKHNEAQKMLEDTKNERQELQRTKDQMIEDAKQEANDKKKELIRQAHKEADEKKQTFFAGIEDQKNAFFRDLRNSIDRQLYQTVKGVLADLADADMEKQAVRAFVKHLDSLDSEESKSFDELIDNVSGSLMISSSFKIEQNLRKEVESKIRSRTDRDMAFSYKEKNDLLCGIELSANGKKIAWSFDGYLSDMREHLSEVFSSYSHQQSSQTEDQKSDEKQKQSNSRSDTNTDKINEPELAETEAEGK